jgi:hypothetical protein
LEEVAEDRLMTALVVEGVALLPKAASGAEEVVGQAKKWEEEVAEEEAYLLQEVAAQVLTCSVAKEAAQADRHFHEEVEAVAFLQQQRLKLGRKNLLEAVEEGHLIEQAVAVGLRKYAYPRKRVVRGICLCLLKAAATQYLPPKESSEVEAEEEDPGLLSWSHDFSKASSARLQTCRHLQAAEEP